MPIGFALRYYGHIKIRPIILDYHSISFSTIHLKHNTFNL